MLRKTVSIITATELTGMSRRAIHSWVQNDKVEYVRTAGGSVRIFLDTLFRTPNMQPIDQDILEVRSEQAQSE